MVRRGPSTERGKAISSRNALKHGLRSDQPIIPGESLEEWDLHWQGIMESSACRTTVACDRCGRFPKISERYELAVSEVSTWARQVALEDQAFPAVGWFS